MKLTHEAENMVLEWEETAKVKPFDASRGWFHCIHNWYGFRDNNISDKNILITEGLRAAISKTEESII
jgi:hypothetical protein